MTSKTELNHINDVKNWTCVYHAYSNAVSMVVVLFVFAIVVSLHWNYFPASSVTSFVCSFCVNMCNRKITILIDTKHNGCASCVHHGLISPISLLFKDIVYHHAGKLHSCDSTLIFIYNNNIIIDYYYEFIIIIVYMIDCHSRSTSNWCFVSGQLCNGWLQWLRSKLQCVRQQSIPLYDFNNFFFFLFFKR